MSLFVANSNFRISLPLQPDGVNLWYFKFRFRHCGLQRYKAGLKIRVTYKKHNQHKKKLFCLCLILLSLLLELSGSPLSFLFMHPNFHFTLKYLECWFLSNYLSIYLFIYLSVYLSLHLSIYLFNIYLSDL